MEECGRIFKSHPYGITDEIPGRIPEGFLEEIARGSSARIPGTILKESLDAFLLKILVGVPKKTPRKMTKEKSLDQYCRYS